MKKTSMILMSSMCGAAGGFGTYFLFDYFHLEMSWSTLLWMVFYVLAGHYLTVLFHEAGHLAGGAAAGMNFHSMLVGPVLLIKERDKTALKWEKHGLSIGGKATMYADIQEKKVSIEKQLYWHILSGPLASLLAGTAALALSFATTQVWLFIFSMLSLLAGITNLVIGETQDAIPDGAALKNLKNPQLKEIFIAAYVIFGNVKNNWNELPSAIAEKARRAVLEKPDNLMSVSVASSIGQYDMSRGAQEEAVTLLGFFTERSPAVKRGYSWDQLDANYLLACYMAGAITDKEDIHRIADRVKKRDMLSYEKAQFVLAAAKGDEKQADEALRRAIDCTSKFSLIYGDGELERTLLQMVDRLKVSSIA
ncbi:site-2 protease family protein [Metabacillus sp. FJAT-52054]|uniref:Site-2 protease family protein n=1 Tax=Metabacillus sediminis TaxID=3117746 RepID=A0ABZ2NIU1_9BACI